MTKQIGTKQMGTVNN